MAGNDQNANSGQEKGTRKVRQRRVAKKKGVEPPTENEVGSDATHTNHASQNDLLHQFMKSQTESMQKMSESFQSLSKCLLEGKGSECEETSQEVSEDMYAAEDIIKCMGTNYEQNYDEDMSDELEALLADLNEPTEFGKPTLDLTARTFNSLSKFVPTKAIKDELKDKYKTPANIPDLTVPSENPEIWSGLPNYARSSDARYQALQQNLVRAQIALTLIMDFSVTNIPKEKVAGILTPILDAGKALTMANQDINMRRRTSLKSLIKPEYAALSSGRLAVTRYLYGDNLEQSLKEAKATTSILKAPSSAGRGRFHPYGTLHGQRHSVGNLNFHRPSHPQERGGLRFRGSRFQSHQFQRGQSFRRRNQ